jgi:hypothetical protein
MFIFYTDEVHFWLQLCISHQGHIGEWIASLENRQDDQLEFGNHLFKKKERPSQPTLEEETHCTTHPQTAPQEISSYHEYSNNFEELQGTALHQTTLVEPYGWVLK